ncbi:peptidoglycan-binding protein [Patescibacteria group bacterium]|nr:peptidoglycan-binding protein [Patescibacteria group bacterium]
MTIAKSVVDKAVVGVVAAAMVFSMFAPAAQAQSTADLQKMIDDLMKQVSALQGQGGTSSSPASGVCPFAWTRDMRIGATGADVMKLQQFLNANADTRVSASGAGSVGMETQTFGPATAAAVSKFQVMHRADILTPAGLVNPTGFFGPSTRAKVNSLCTSAPAPVPGDEDEDEDESEDEDMELSGEASLDSFESDDADETEVQEGEADVVIGEFKVEFTDGDAEISRLDVALTHATGSPWDAFETISLWVDGEKIAEMEAGDEDDYLDEDAGSLRFSDLQLVAMEDEELTISIGAEVQNNLDADELGDWDLNALAIRFFDADGVSDTVTSGTGFDLGTGASKAAEFTIEEAGEGEELKFSLASDNPDSTDIIVDEDSVTNEVTILKYNIEADEGDIELDRLVVRVETAGASTSNVVNDITLVVDGQTFSDESLGTLATGKSEVDGNAIWYLFDIDGDVTIDEDEEVDVEVVVDLKRRAAGTYANGQRITASVGNSERGQTKAEGAEDLVSTDFKGTAVGENHTLVATGIVVPVDGFTGTIKTLGTNSTVGEFTLEFEVTAVEGDYYIAQVASSAALTSGIRYAVEGTVGTGSVSASIDSSADETADVFIVREGESETFTLKVSIDPQNTGTFKVGLTGVNWSADTNGVNDGAVGEDDLYVPTPAQDFDTDSQTIQGAA